MVMTTKEASEKYPVADCTVRSWIKDGIVAKNDYRKSGNTWIIKKETLVKILKEKGMLSKLFIWGKDKIYAEHFAYKDKNLEIWYENQNVKNAFELLPYDESTFQIFSIYKKEKRLKIKYLIIKDDPHQSDNWLYEKEGIWIITLKGVTDTINDAIALNRQEGSFFK